MKNGSIVLVDGSRETDIIYLDFCKAIETVLSLSLSLIWRDMDLMDGPLRGSGTCWMTFTESCGQWLIVHAETRDEWGPSGSVFGLILFNSFVGAMDSGITDDAKLCGAVTCWREGVDPEGLGQAGEVGTS
ncbi:hypothetical protein HGM15179_018027 [Zosterops borbonicus]|uniref:Uncharacterized protein n=1 Tax=Zosterops borbonicus TaxID=364589 RepID=A0A8K1LCP7_9PASS|nr:hypothetical protein HGM15179_018027 [Zosterops borbonicus]